METEFWHNKWHKNEIGFHQQAVNPLLQQHWPAVAAGGRVLVPMCGKSLDMLWLRERGLNVVGIELSEKAVAAFFAENGLQPVIETRGEHQWWRVDGLALICGDFFTVTQQMIGPVQAIYDRAALIALPESMRVAYVEHLQHLVPGGAQTLLLTLQYPPGTRKGPPFSVYEADVRRLYEPRYQVTLKDHIDGKKSHPGLVTAGVNELTDDIFLLQPRASKMP